MKSSIYSNRYLKVETTSSTTQQKQQQSPLTARHQHTARSPVTARKSPNHHNGHTGTSSTTTATTPSFMKSTASSIGKVTSPRMLSPLSPSDYYNNSNSNNHHINNNTDLDTREKLMQDLIRFTRSSDRRMMIRTLKDSTLLQQIQIDDSIFHTTDYPTSSEAWDDIKNDIVDHLPIDINGITMGATLSNDREKQQEGEKLLSILPLLCNKLVQGISNNNNSTSKEQNKNISSDELYRILLLRLSNKRNAAITMLQVNKVLGCKDLAIQVPKRPIKPLQRSNVVVYVADNALHAVTEHQYAIGLFRKSDSAGRPWIGLTATFRERINLSNNQAVRYIALQIHEEKPVVY